MVWFCIGYIQASGRAGGGFACTTGELSDLRFASAYWRMVFPLPNPGLIRVFAKAIYARVADGKINAG